MSGAGRQLAAPVAMAKRSHPQRRVSGETLVEWPNNCNAPQRRQKEKENRRKEEREITRERGREAEWGFGLWRRRGSTEASAFTCNMARKIYDFITQ